MRRAAALGLLALLLIAGCAAPGPRQSPNVPPNVSPNVQSETGHVDSDGGGGGGGSM
jgi:hypothetical protein